MGDQATSVTEATASISEQLSALDSGRISARDLAELYLDRIERINPRLNAVVTVDAEGARRAADRADAARRDGRPHGALLGIPFTVKDAIATAGVRTTAGAAPLRDHVPPADAPAIGRLRQEGAVLLGKTNLPVWSSNIQTHNEMFGTTNNPWDPARTPGGSSGGAAAAVAAGLTGFDVGSDLGGSIRIPAHFCGIAGHRPSYGLVSQQGYIDHVGGGSTGTDLNVLGPLARRVADLRLLLHAMLGPDPDQAPAWHAALPPARRDDPRQWRVAVWLDDGPDTFLTDDVRRVIEDALAAAADRGMSVARTRPDVDVAACRSVCAELIAAATLPSRARPPAGDPADSHLRWLRDREGVARLRAAWGRWFRDWDAVICPVMSVPAFPHDHGGTIGELSLRVDGRDVSHRRLAHMWNAPSGVAGLPSTVVPVGLTPQRLPVGVQVIGPYLEDLTALAVAELVETASGGYTAPPSATP